MSNMMCSACLKVGEPYKVPGCDKPECPANGFARAVAPLLADPLERRFNALGWQGGTFWQVLEEVRRLRAGWQPMATAPKDGTEFLAWFPKHRIDEDGDSTDEVVGGAQAIIAYTEANGWDEPQWLDAHGAYYMDDWCFAEAPTLWHPLPAEPHAPGVRTLDGGQQ